MASYTKLLRFNRQTIRTIMKRDNNQCLFCTLDYYCENLIKENLDYLIHDIAHFIPKSKLGLGIEENGVECCRYHHHMLDNGNKGLKKEMLMIIEKYLKSLYPNWDKNKLVYKKYDNK